MLFLLVSHGVWHVVSVILIVYFRLQIEEMIEKVSYPDYILDTKFVDDYYKQVNKRLDGYCRKLHPLSRESSSCSKCIFYLPVI